ncbi:hypothetical protein K439DRAFT_1639496 [Ramaria rubella]|nr:hypothetical protein K439DRAFT_1639496 [Ramaria rubella]
MVNQKREPNQCKKGRKDPGGQKRKRKRTSEAEAEMYQLPTHRTHDREVLEREGGR